jgi:hypothetical protein
VQDGEIPIWVSPSGTGRTPSVDVPSAPVQLFIDGPGDCSAPDAASSDALVVAAPASAGDAAAAAAAAAAAREWVCAACGLDSGAAVVLPLAVDFPAAADQVRVHVRPQCLVLGTPLHTSVHVEVTAPRHRVSLAAFADRQVTGILPIAFNGGTFMCEKDAAAYGTVRRHLTMLGPVARRSPQMQIAGLPTILTSALVARSGFTVVTSLDSSAAPAAAATQLALDGDDVYAAAALNATGLARDTYNLTAAAVLRVRCCRA